MIKPIAPGVYIDQSKTLVFMRSTTGKWIAHGSVSGRWSAEGLGNPFATLAEATEYFAGINKENTDGMA